jgi:hypothetical protein
MILPQSLGASQSGNGEGKAGKRLRGAILDFTEASHGNGLVSARIDLIRTVRLNIRVKREIRKKINAAGGAS